MQTLLSLVIPTFGKHDVLELVLDSLIKELDFDYEIIIVDGTPGNVDQFKQKLLKFAPHALYIAQPDFGESHAINIALLRAKGLLIKVITDDDAFNFARIKHQAEFLLQNPDIDILGSDGIALSGIEGYAQGYLGYEEEYSKYQRFHTPFAFCGLGLMLRREVLALSGLFDTFYTRADLSFTYRITGLGLRLAWDYTPSYCRILHPKSVSITYNDRLEAEGALADWYYRDRFTIPEVSMKISSAVLIPYAKQRRSELINCPSPSADANLGPSSYTARHSEIYSQAMQYLRQATLKQIVWPNG